MNERKSLLRSLSLVPASAITLCSVVLLGTGGALAMAADQSVDQRGHGHDNGKTSFATRSSPIAITRDDKFVWSVNPDTDSVSVFLVAKDANKKVAEIPVGKEPWCVAIKSENDDDDHDRGKGRHNDDDDSKVYVTNMVSGTVSVIDAETMKLIKTIKVGTEPFGCALSPDGHTLYVAAFGSSKIGVLDTTALESNSFDPTAASASYITLSGGGPTGVVLDQVRNQLYALTRFDNAVKVVNLGSRGEVASVALNNPEPAAVIKGRPTASSTVQTMRRRRCACITSWATT